MHKEIMLQNTNVYNSVEEFCLLLLYSVLLISVA